MLSVSYLSGVADTRGSPTARFVDLVEAEGGSTVVYDPIATRWEGRPGVAIVADPFAVDLPVDTIVLAVAACHFRELDPVRLVAHFSTSMAVVDGWNLLGQEHANAALQARWQVQVIGRGTGCWC